MPAVKPRKRIERDRAIRLRMIQWLEQNPKATRKERYVAFDQIADEVYEVDSTFIEKELTKRS